MATLIPNVQIKDFQPHGRPCEVFEGERYIGTWLPANPHDCVVADRIRIRAEQLGMQSNSIYPPESTPPVAAIPALEDKRLTALAKGRAVLKAKREVALATR